MAKTNFFKQIQRAIKVANIANRYGLSASETLSLLEEAKEKRKFDQSRRKFMQKSALLALAAAPGINLLSMTRAFAQSPNDRVLIIGGGAAGLSAAYQLKKQNVPFLIIEASGRLGGRILTGRNFNADNQFVELGAELVDTNHYTLIGLAEELGVEIEDFAENDKGFEPELFHYNGQNYTQAQFIEAVLPLVKNIKKANEEIYNGVDDYINAKNREQMPKLADYDRKSLRQFLEEAKAETPDWVVNGIEVAYVCEFGVDSNQLSSICLIDTIDTSLAEDAPATDPNASPAEKAAAHFSMFGESDESKRVKGGNDTLIAKLVESLELTEQSLQLNASLEAITEPSDKSGLICHIRRDGVTRQIAAKHVICAIPFTILRNVSGFSAGANQLAGISPEKLRLIRELNYGKNTKMMMSFKEKFWRTKFSPKTAGTLYTNAASQSFWETSRLQAGERGIITNYSGGSQAQRVADQGNNAVYAALRDLENVYGREIMQQQYEGRVRVMPWPNIRFVRGSYSAPSVGQFSTIWGYNADPELDGRLQFAGEHTHPLSWGFMNGGYNSGFHAANRVLEALGKEQPPIPGRAAAEGTDSSDN